jgi:hypothetical protein
MNILYSRVQCWAVLRVKFYTKKMFSDLPRYTMYSNEYFKGVDIIEFITNSSELSTIGLSTIHDERYYGKILKNYEWAQSKNLAI